MSVVDIANKPKPNWTEAKIVSAIAADFFKRKCILLVNNCIWTGYECDVLGITSALYIVDIEVKISRADLKVDAKKDKWWHRQFLGYGPEEKKTDASGRLISISRKSLYDTTHREWPPKVWKHYYAMPEEIWRDDLADDLGSPSSGVLLLRLGQRGVSVSSARRAKANPDAQKINHAQAIDIARLQNLRMWEAYKIRDAANADYRNRINQQETASP